MLAIFFMLLDYLMTIFKINFFKKLFQKQVIKVSNSLDPDQDLQNFGPDLGPNCYMERFSADYKR